MKHVLLAAAAVMSISSTASAAPLLGVYEGGGCPGKTQIPQYEGMIGHKADMVSDFVDWTSTWSNMVVSTNYIAGCWQGSGYKLNLSVPLMVKAHDGSPLHELAAGDYDSYFTEIAETLVSHGYGDAYIRLGEEFNQGYYPWAAAPSPSLWITGYRHAQAAMKAVPGAHFRFVWNPAQFEGQVYPDQAYPGDDVVDVIAQDTYNETWDGDAFSGGKPIPGKFWSKVYGDSWGVKDLLTFAAKHAKPYAFPEWGTGTRGDGHGGGDDPVFMSNMIPIVAKAEFAAYWDYNASDFDAQLSDGHQPIAGALYEQAYASPGIKAILAGHASAFTATAAPTLTCTNCHVLPIQTAPGHWDFIVWAHDAQPAASLAWTGATTNSNLYDPAAGTTPIKALGAVNTASFVLAAGKPLIVAAAQ